MSKNDLMAIYNLEFYKSKKKWTNSPKSHRDGKNHSSNQTQDPLSCGDQVFKQPDNELRDLNKTYSIDTGSNDAFFVSGPSDIEPDNIDSGDENNNSFVNFEHNYQQDGQGHGVWAANTDGVLYYEKGFTNEGLYFDANQGFGDQMNDCHMTNEAEVLTDENYLKNLLIQMHNGNVIKQRFQHVRTCTRNEIDSNAGVEENQVLDNFGSNSSLNTVLDMEEAEKALHSSEIDLKAEANEQTKNKPVQAHCGPTHQEKANSTRKKDTGRRINENTNLFPLDNINNANTSINKKINPVPAVKTLENNASVQLSQNIRSADDENNDISAYAKCIVPISNFAGRNEHWESMEHPLPFDVNFDHFRTPDAIEMPFQVAADGIRYFEYYPVQFDFDTQRMYFVSSSKMPPSNYNYSTQNSDMPLANLNTPAPNLNMQSLDKNMQSLDINMPPQNINIQSQDTNMLSQYINMPAQNINMQSQNKNRQSQKTNMKSLCTNMSPQNINMQSQNRNMQSLNTNMPSQNINIQSQYTNMPPQNINMQSQKTNTKSRYTNLPPQNKNKKPQNLNMQSLDRNMPSQNINKQQYNLNIASQNPNMRTINFNRPSQKRNLQASNINIPSQNRNIPSRKINMPPQNRNIPSPNINNCLPNFNVPPPGLYTFAPNCSLSNFNTKPSDFDPVKKKSLPNFDVQRSNMRWLHSAPPAATGSGYSPKDAENTFLWEDSREPSPLSFCVGKISKGRGRLTS